MMMLVAVVLYWKGALIGFALFIIDDLYGLRAQLLKEKTNRENYADFLEIKNNRLGKNKRLG